MATRAELNGQRRGYASNPGNRYHAVESSGAVRGAIFIEPFEIGRQREGERLRVSEQRPPLGFDPAGTKRFGLGPRYGQLCELGWIRGGNLLSRCLPL